MSELEDRVGETGSPADGARLAVGTLTVFRVRAPSVVDRTSAGWAMTLAPLVGLLLVLPVGLLVWLLGYGPAGPQTFLWRTAEELAPSGVHPPSPLVVAVVVIGLLALLTRGLHLDGLADTADGLGSGRPAVEALAVMRRSDIGPFGVVTLVLVLALQVAALAQLLAIGRGLLGVAFAVVVSRLALPLACLRGTPAARADGLGAVVAGTVSLGKLLLSGGLAVGAVVGCSLVVLLGTWGHAAWPAPDTLVAAGLAAALALAAGRLFVRRCVHRLGGITGDVLGAAVEITLSVVLLLLTFL